MDHFWRRWRTEYLAGLRETHKHLLGRARKGASFSVGDVVIVQDEGLPAVSGSSAGLDRDGQMRGATVSVTSKGRSHITLNRPLQLLYLLKIDHPPDPKMDHPDPLNSPGDIGLENVPGETDHPDDSAKPRHP